MEKKKTRNRKPINMLGFEFQTWKVISQSDKKSSGNNTYWLCECQICKKQKELCGTEIRMGRTGVCNHKHQQEKDENYIKNDYIKVENSKSNTIKNELGKSYGRLIVKSFAYTQKSKAYWLCECQCGKTIITKGSSLRNGEVLSCGCLSSYKEEEIVKILEDKNIIFKRQFVFPDLKDISYLRFDFAIFNSKNELIGLIEYQGIQHYEKQDNFGDFEKLQKHDKMKKDYCKTNNIPLLELNKDNSLYIDIINWYNKII